MSKKYDWVSFILHSNEANPNAISIYIGGLKIENNINKFDLYNYNTIDRKLNSVNIGYIEESLKIIISSEYEKHKQLKKNHRDIVLKDYSNKCTTCNIIDNSFIKALINIKNFNTSVVNVKEFNSNTAPLVPLTFSINKNLLEYSNDELIKFINKSIITYSRYTLITNK